MAAGLGFKTFTTGEVLTAADTNGYLMQGVLVFASSAARSAAITSPQEGQYSYLKDTNSTEYYDGAAWIAAPIGDITGVTAGTGISGGGTSGTVTITNSMATEITAAGDIIVGTGSGTFDNLPIGTTGQLLTADTTVSPYKVKWATPAATSSGMTLVSSATFTNAATVTIDSVFSSTYKSYMGILSLASVSTAADDLQMQMRYGSTTQSSAVYLGSQFQYNRNNSLSTGGYVSVAQATITTSISQVGTPTLITIFFDQVGQSAQNASFYGNGLDADVQAACVFSGLTNQGQTYTGFLLKGSSANITGRYAVYGLAN